jgi:hypothetical protein
VMKPHAQDLVAAAAVSLAGKAHTVEAMHEALYQLALDLFTPWSSSPPSMMRRMPGAYEVLPRHQRASWARAKTEYDVDHD